jgi:predicted metal-dependent peptidase
MGYPVQEKQLQDLIFEMLCHKDYMFYGLFITEVNKEFNMRVPTACIGKHPNVKIPMMTFNPEFWDKLTKPQRRFLVIHELRHYIDLAWVYRQEFNLDAKLFNIAADLNINTTILSSHLDMELIEGGMMPELFPELNLQPCRDSMYYYNRLKDAKDKKEDSKGTEDSLAGEPGNKNGTSGCKELDKMLDSGDGIPDHTTWDELTEGMSDVEKEMLKREIASAVERIAEESQKNAGSLPVGIEQAMKINKIKQVVSWKNLFRRFVSTTIDTDVLQTRKHPNRRFEGMPTNKFKQKVKGLFLSDSSGSVSDSDLERCNAELYNVYKAGAEIHYAAWDAECENPKKYDGKLDIERTMCGGTDLNCALKKINEKSKEGYKFAVITTDGYVPPITEKVKIPVLILITQTGTLDFNNQHNYKTIRINN